jgi:hypothetical protein
MNRQLGQRGFGLILESCRWCHEQLANFWRISVFPARPHLRRSQEGPVEGRPRTLSPSGGRRGWKEKGGAARQRPRPDQVGEIYRMTSGCTLNQSVQRMLLSWRNIQVAHSLGNENVGQRGCRKDDISAFNGPVEQKVGCGQ